MERFWSKVYKEQSIGGCWLWTACHGKTDGIGRFRVGSMTDGTRSTTTSPRYAWKLCVEDPAVEDVVANLCGNSACVRPEHHEAITKRALMVRMDIWARSAESQKARPDCVNGHPFRPGSFHLRQDGARICHRCAAENSARWYRSDLVRNRARSRDRMRVARAKATRTGGHE